MSRGGGYVGRYELRAHFSICAKCAGADLGSSAGFSSLCIVGARLVKDYASHSRKAIEAAKREQGRAVP